MFTRIDHVALHVNNIEKSTKFYVENFGFQDYFYNVVAIDLKIRYLKLGDTLLELSGHSDGEIIGFHFCLQTMDFLNSINKLIKNNVKILCAPHPTNARNEHEEGWFRALFEGPDGEQIEIRGKNSS